ncbi:MAG: diguanylate cyclase, partial [Candidatus Competibacterales bacterium]
MTGYARRLVGFLVLYGVAVWLGLLLEARYDGLTPLWPASGLALAMVWRWGWCYWPVVAVGEFATAVLLLQQPVLQGILGASIQLGEMALAVYLLRPFGPYGWQETYRGVLSFVALGALLSPIGGALLGTLGLCGFGLLSWDSYPVAAALWWLGDAMGILIVAPVLLTYDQWSFQDRRARQRYDLIVAVLIGCGVLLAWGPVDGRPLFFLLMPLVAFAAIAGNMAGASVATALLALVVLGLAQGEMVTDFALAVHIAFVGTAALTGQCLAVALANARRLRIQLEHRTRHDTLTELPNRQTFEALLREGNGHLSPARGLLVIDLDQFKLVNDSTSHQTGNRLLRELAGVLEGALAGKPAVLARFGGDEFAVVVDGEDEEALLTLAEGLRCAIQGHLFQVDGRRLTLTASIGATLIDPGEDPVVHALKRADVARFAAKEQGRNRVCFYRGHEEDLRLFQGDMHQASRLRAVLEAHGFRLYGQRIAPALAAPLATAGPEDPPSFEVLLRLADDGQWVSPGRILPSVERFGLMLALDQWVIERVFALHGRHPSPRRFFIKLCGAPLHAPHFAAVVTHRAAPPG